MVPKHTPHPGHVSLGYLYVPMAPHDGGHHAQNPKAAVVAIGLARTTLIQKRCEGDRRRVRQEMKTHHSKKGGCCPPLVWILRGYVQWVLIPV